MIYILIKAAADNISAAQRTATHMGTPGLWVLGLLALCAILRRCDVKTSLKIPFAMFSLEIREPRNSNQPEE